MDKEDPNHDRLARRLTDILSRLNYGDTLDIDELALEYGVHRRTVQRDLHERFDFLPLEKKEGRYTLARSHLGCLGLEDIRRFAALAGLSGLFPALDKTFIREWLESRLQSVVDVHGVGYEDLGAKVNDFRTLQRAITQQQRVRFTYHKPESSKQVEAEPYRLINNTGLWYLAAVEVESGLPKSYALSKLTNPQGLDHVFSPEASVREMLDQEDSIWLNTQKTEVVLTIAAPAASYFRRRKLIAQQVIEKELADGGLILSGKFAHPDQVFPTVRQWIPHVRIVSPKAWQEELEAGVRGYLAD